MDSVNTFYPVADAFTPYSPNAEDPESAEHMQVVLTEDIQVELDDKGQPLWRHSEPEVGVLKVPFTVRALYGGLEDVPYEAKEDINFRIETSDEISAYCEDDQYDNQADCDAANLDWTEVAPGGATPGDDYVDISGAGFSQLIPSGSLDASYSLTINSDDVLEKWEFFELRLKEPSSPNARDFDLVVSEANQRVRIWSPERLLISYDANSYETTEGQSTTLTYSFVGVPNDDRLKELNPGYWTDDRVSCHSALAGDSSIQHDIELGFDFRLSLDLLLPEDHVGDCDEGGAICDDDLTYSNEVAFPKGRTQADSVTVTITGKEDEKPEGTERGRFLTERLPGTNTHIITPLERGDCAPGQPDGTVDFTLYDSGGLASFVLNVDRVEVARFLGSWGAVPNATNYKAILYEFITYKGRTSAGKADGK